MGERKTNQWAVMLYWIPFFVAFFLYLPTLGFEFVQDDLIHIVDNPLVTGGGSYIEIFRQGLFPGTLYRPILIVSYRMTHDLVGLDPAWFHAGNILLHAVVSVLVVVVLKRVLSFREALLAGILFAVLPLHVEAVANVSGRSELLSHLFGLLLLAVATSKTALLTRAVLSPAGFVLVFSLALLSFLSKESGLVYFPLLLLIYWFQSSDKTSGQRSPLKISCAAVICAASLSLWLRRLAIGSVVSVVDQTAFFDNPLLREAGTDRALNGFILLGKYLYLCFVPTTLVRDYSYSQQEIYTSIFEFEPLVYLLLAFIFLLLAFQGLKRREKGGFCALFFFISFGITANVLFPIGTIFAERLAYLPSVGAVGMLVVYLAFLKMERLRMLVFALLCTAFCSQTVLFSQFWRSSETLYQRQAQVSAHSVKALVNYSVVLRNKGKLGDARASLSRASRIAPDYPETDFAMATLELSAGRISEAKEALLLALSKNPRMLPALTMMGRLLFNEGNLRQAELYFRRALKVDANNVEGLMGAFALHLKRGNIRAASKVHLALKRLVPQSEEFQKLESIFKKIQKQRTPPSSSVQT